jgi:glycosyltransferase involved in cell wall biosynthesis
MQEDSGMSIEISVIVPVYNVKEYLPQCLDSIINQTFRDIEILVIDDGSSDGSEKICDEYASKDPRLHVFHQANAGLSAARNLGIDHAVGKYLSFIDSDDYIDPEMLNIMHHNIQKEKADIAVCGMYRVKRKTVQAISSKEYSVMSGREFFKMILIGEKINVTACDKLYAKECFDHLRYPVGKQTEDGYIAVDLFPKAERIVVDMTPLYYYRFREDSFTNAAYTSGDLDMIEAYERCLLIVKKEYPECIDAAEMRYLRGFFIVYDKMILAHMPEAKQYKKTLQQNTSLILKNPYLYRTRKLGFLVMCISSRLYRMVAVWYENKVDERELS